MFFSFPFLPNKVGEQEEKLAEGIKLYALLATATSKRTVLSDLITVSLQLCFYNLSSIFGNFYSLYFSGI